MSLSKSKSGNKWQRSILARTKLCRGDSPDSQIDSDALVSSGRKPSNSSLSRSNRVLEMQETPMGLLEEDMKVLREQLACAEADRNRALDELKEITKVIIETNYLKDVLLSTQKELEAKDRDMECLRSELEKAKQAETKLIEAEASEAQSHLLLSDLRSRIKELEADLENKLKILASLEQTKLEVETLREKIKLMEETAVKEEARGSEREKAASLKITSLSEEITLLKNGLKSATEAEKKSKKAMDGLVSATKEVASEAFEAKENVKAKLTKTQLELNHVRKENVKLKERYKKELEEAKREAEIQRNAAERVRLEAEETLLAWNEKEMGFVSWIKGAEEERDKAYREINRLRDIMKQAISEANAAKAAANIAIDENSKLQDSLVLLTQENERLKSAAPK